MQGFTDLHAQLSEILAKTQLTADKAQQLQQSAKIFQTTTATLPQDTSTFEQLLTALDTQIAAFEKYYILCFTSEEKQRNSIFKNLHDTHYGITHELFQTPIATLHYKASQALNTLEKLQALLDEEKPLLEQEEQANKIKNEQRAENTLFPAALRKVLDNNQQKNLKQKQAKYTTKQQQLDEKKAALTLLLTQAQTQIDTLIKLRQLRTTVSPQQISITTESALDVLNRLKLNPYNEDHIAHWEQQVGKFLCIGGTKFIAPNEGKSKHCLPHRAAKMMEEVKNMYNSNGDIPSQQNTGDLFLKRFNVIRTALTSHSLNFFASLKRSEDSENLLTGDLASVQINSAKLSHN